MTKHNPHRRISARATATVTISFPVSGGGWGDDVQLAQVFDQARDAAEGQVRNAFKPEARITIESIALKAIIGEEGER